MRERKKSAREKMRDRNIKRARERKNENKIEREK